MQLQAPHPLHQDRPPCSDPAKRPRSQPRQCSLILHGVSHSCPISPKAAHLPFLLSSPPPSCAALISPTITSLVSRGTGKALQSGGYSLATGGLDRASDVASGVVGVPTPVCKTAVLPPVEHHRESACQSSTTPTTLTKPAQQHEVRGEAISSLDITHVRLSRSPSGCTPQPCSSRRSHIFCLVRMRIASTSLAVDQKSF